MNLLSRLLAPALLAATLAGWTAGASAQDRSRAMDTGPFRQIEISGIGAQITIVQGDREELAVEASPGTVAKIRVENVKGVLTVSVGEDRSGWKMFGFTGSAPRITITFRTLEALRVSGAIKVEAARVAVPSLDIEATGATQLRVSALDVDRLSLEGSGAVKAEFAGRAKVQRIELSGAVDYRAADLSSDDATIEVSGAGRAVVRAEKTLDVDVSGAGSVEYLGNPSVTQDVSGAARVRRRDRLGAHDSPSGA